MTVASPPAPVGRPRPPGGAPGSVPALGRRQLLLVFAAVMAGMFLAALDQTIVSTALPTMVGELGGVERLSWVVTAYLLTSTASTPLYGKLSDLYGRRPLFQVAIGVFLVGSALAGLSADMTQLVAFRAIQGIGAGGLISLGMAIVGDVVSPRERGRYQGYVGGVFALASVAGPLIGGFLVENLSWRWVFLVNLPVGAVALAVAARVLPAPRRQESRSVDYLGSALLVAAVTCLLLVTVWGGNELAWGSPTILALACGGLGLAVAFVAWELRTTEPLLPMSLFSNRVFRNSSLAGFLVGMVIFGTVVFVPLHLQIVGGLSPTGSGLVLVPFMLGIVVTSTVAGRLISRRGRYKIFPVIGTALVVVGILLLGRVDAATSRPTMSAFLVVVGVGLGMVMQVLVLATQNAVAHRDLGVATSAMSFFRTMGGAFGVAAFGSILSSGLARHLPRLAGAGLDPSALRASPQRLAQLPEAVRAGVSEAFARSLHTVFLWALPIAVLAFLVVLALEELPLRGTVGHEEGPLPTPAPVVEALVD